MKRSTRASLLEATRQRAQTTGDRLAELELRVEHALELLPGDGGVWLASPKVIAERIKRARATLLGRVPPPQ